MAVWDKEEIVTGELVHPYWSFAGSNKAAVTRARRGAGVVAGEPMYPAMSGDGVVVANRAFRHLNSGTVGTCPTASAEDPPTPVALRPGLKWAVVRPVYEQQSHFYDPGQTSMIGWLDCYNQFLVDPWANPLRRNKYARPDPYPVILFIERETPVGGYNYFAYTSVEQPVFAAPFPHVPVDETYVWAFLSQPVAAANETDCYIYWINEAQDPNNDYWETDHLLLGVVSKDDISRDEDHPSLHLVMGPAGMRGPDGEVRIGVASGIGWNNPLAVTNEGDFTNPVYGSGSLIWSTRYNVHSLRVGAYG